MGKMEDRMMKGLKQLMPQQAQEDTRKTEARKESCWWHDEKKRTTRWVA